MKLIDIEIEETFDKEGNSIWNIKIKAGGLTLKGELTDADMLRFVRGHPYGVSLKNASAFGMTKINGRKYPTTITSESLNLREANES